MADELEMQFDPNTIEHLGVKMYSQIPTAIAELIANSYDASAKNVTVFLHDDGKNKSIVVTDDGDGMTFDEVNDKFLRIGRNRRVTGDAENRLGRKITGKKGLGKLALFGIGDIIEVITQKDGVKVHFKMDWNAVKATTGANYKPEIIAIERDAKTTGTEIILSKLKRKSPFQEYDLAVSLSKLFNFFDANFQVKVIHGAVEVEVTKELRYDNIESQFEFDVSKLMENVQEKHPNKNDMAGCILTTEKPLKAGMRGITLFANGRLVNAPEFFGRSESSHFYSYATGWIEVDFIDDWQQDVISTNRQSLNWDLEETEKLREFLQAFVQATQKEWREQRKLATTTQITTDTNINIEAWFAKLPDDVQPSVEKIVNNIVKKELSKEDQKSTVEELNKLIPAYPYYHWRNLHPGIQEVSAHYYRNEDYYSAFHEAVKKFANATRQKAGIAHTVVDYDMMAKAFHKDSGTLTVTPNYTRADGARFSPQTLGNIQNGQFQFSQGVIAGGRNTVAHEEIRDLRESGLFSEKDCLDLLSLLSHLHNRLDNAVLRTDGEV